MSERSERIEHCRAMLDEALRDGNADRIARWQWNLAAAERSPEEE